MRVTRLRVVLVHGNAGSARTWDRVAPLLAEHAVAAPDLPGFGAAANAPLPTSDPLAAYTQCVADAARALPGDGPIVLAGNGAGCLLAARAARTLGSVAGLVLTGPVGVAGGHSRLRALSTSGVGAWFLRIAGVSAIGREKFLSDQLASPRADTEAATILCTALLVGRGFHLLARASGPEALAGLRDLACPVVVLWGERDGVLPVARADELLAHLPPHTVLSRVAAASHALPLERPDLVAAAVASFAAPASTAQAAPPAR